MEKNEKWINILINSEPQHSKNPTDVTDAGVSESHGEIDDVEQTPEAVAKEMFDKESFETW